MVLALENVKTGAHKLQKDGHCVFRTEKACHTGYVVSRHTLG